jgi:hypothetical protein
MLSIDGGIFQPSERYHFSKRRRRERWPLFMKGNRSSSATIPTECIDS